MVALSRPLLCLVTDRRRLSPRARTVAIELLALERLVDDAIDAGVDLIQVRERDLPARAIRDFARRAVGRARGTRTAVLVNDRADIARAAGAAGVHLPADGLPAVGARAIGPAEGWLVGRSIHEGDDAAAFPDVDYLLFGTVFPTASKPGVRTAGVEGLRRAASSTRTPVVAIGGMTPERAARAVAAGAAGVAAIGVFLPDGVAPDALGAAAATAALRAALVAGAASADPR